MTVVGVFYDHKKGYLPVAQTLIDKADLLFLWLLIQTRVKVGLHQIPTNNLSLEKNEELGIYRKVQYLIIETDRD